MLNYMINMFFVIIIALTNQTFAGVEKPWLGKWRVERLICPDDCPGIKALFPSLKLKFVEFKIDEYQELYTNCQPPLKVDWRGLKTVAAEDYLGNWGSRQPVAKTKGNFRLQKKNLEKAVELKLRSLGLSREQNVIAGVVRCSSGEAFNLISVDPGNALILFEEGSFFKLTR